jgi:hypothetical protein
VWIAGTAKVPIAETAKTPIAGTAKVPIVGTAKVPGYLFDMALLGSPQRPGANWTKIFVISGIGCLVIVGIGAFAIFRLFSAVIGEVMNEETFEVSEPGEFDPFADLGEVTAGVGAKARLVSIEASGVRPDGTMDLSADYTPSPRATYEFIEPTEEGKERMPPVGAGRKPDDIWARGVKAEAYRPGQRSHITKMGGNVNAEYWHVNEGVTVKFETPRAQALPEALAAPSLSTREMWEKAISLGALRDAVARVSYDAEGYEFDIAGTGFSLRWEVNGEFSEEDSRYPSKSK